MKKVIAFDLDGTLIDSNNLHVDSHCYAAKKLNLKISRKKMSEIFILNTTGLLKKYFPKIKKEEIEIFKKIEQEHLFKIIKKSKPFPEVVKTLEELKKKNKIIIISNTNYELILKTLREAGLNPIFFDLIVGGDLVKKSKPEPDELLIAKKILKHNVDYFVGDCVVDIKAGKKAKVKTIAITTGFNTRKEFEKLKPYAIIDKVEEIFEVIKA